MGGVGLLGLMGVEAHELEDGRLYYGDCGVLGRGGSCTSFLGFLGRLRSRRGILDTFVAELRS